MFLLNEILVFTPGRRQEALERLNWIHGLMASKPGFQRAIVAKYLGDGSRHTVLRMWDGEAAYKSFREGPDGNYGRGRPPGLYTNEPVVPQWNSLLETRGTSDGNYLVKVEREDPEDTRTAFGLRQEQLQQFLLALGGFVELLSLRAKDQNRNLTIARYHDRSDFERILESDEYARLSQSMPAGVTRLSTQCFEVVSEVGPSP